MSLVFSQRKLDTTKRRRLTVAINKGKVPGFLDLRFGEGKKKRLLEIRYIVLLNKKISPTECYTFGRMIT
jgi:hypothetical protein